MLKSIGFAFFLVLTSLSVPSFSFADGIGHCAGTSAGCDKFAIANCSDQKGCFVKPDGKACRGESFGCLFFMTGPSCFKQSGCTWTP